MQQQTYTHPQFWTWVRNHLGQNASRLRLSSHPENDINLDEAITQVECRERFGKKLSSTLAAFPDFYFPTTLSGEQATSDLIASFHTQLVKPDDTLVDLTAGLGIDFLHLARVVSGAIGIERSENLCHALAYNAKGLGIANVEIIKGDSVEVVQNLKGSVAYIDPSRRAADGSRVFGLKDCEPDVIELLPTLKERFNRLIVKASPMLDISQTINDLPGAKTIYILGTPTECKELVVTVDFSEIDSGVIKPVTISAVTIFADGTFRSFDFTRDEEVGALPIIARKNPTTNDVLYVPYPATMKAGPVRLLSEKFNLEKFHNNTHLYFGAKDTMSTEFPGEILRIEEVIPWQSKNIKRFKSRYPNVMVSVRNFGMSADALRTKLGVKEGGNKRLRLFGIGLGNDHTDRVLIVASPL